MSDIFQLLLVVYVICVIEAMLTCQFGCRCDGCRTHVGAGELPKARIVRNR